MSLALRPERESANVLPFAIRWRKTRRAAKRELARLAVDPAKLITAAQVVFDQAVLDQVRQQARKRAMEKTGRMSKRAWFAYVCKPEGRRALRAMAKLSERVEDQEARLCG